MLVWRAGYLKDSGQPNTTETSIAKLYATEAAIRCANTAIQVHGGSGYVDDYPGRALPARRARDDPVRGDLPDPEADHRAGADGHRRARPEVMFTTQRARPPRRDRRRRRGDDGRGHRPAGLSVRRAHAAARSAAGGARVRGSSGSGAISARSVERGRSGELGRGGRRPDRLEAVAELEGFAPCELVIEAAPESLEVKRELFERLAEVVSDECVLATNTSSLPVTAIAGGLQEPRARGGHALLQPRSGHAPARGGRGRGILREALARARRRARRWASGSSRLCDGPGFLVNRCARPYGLEAARLLAEGIASVEQIDRICRLERRLSHGAVRAGGPGGPRHPAVRRALLLRAELRRAAMAAVADHRAAGGRGAAGAQVRAAVSTTTRTGSTGRPIRSRPLPGAARARS